MNVKIRTCLAYNIYTCIVYVWHIAKHALKILILDIEEAARSNVQPGSYVLVNLFLVKHAPVTGIE